MCGTAARKVAAESSLLGTRVHWRLNTITLHLVGRPYHVKSSSKIDFHTACSTLGGTRLYRYQGLQGCTFMSGFWLRYTHYNTLFLLLYGHERKVRWPALLLQQIAQYRCHPEWVWREKPLLETLAFCFPLECLFNRMLDALFASRASKLILGLKDCNFCIYKPYVELFRYRFHLNAITDRNDMILDQPTASQDRIRKRLLRRRTP